MMRKVRDVMRGEPVCLPAESSVTAAAKAMREADIGCVIVEEEGQVCGLLTDRDIVVRVVADEKSPNTVSLGDACSRQLVALSPDDTVDDAVQLMAERALRRLPVMEGGHPVGILGIGDLAIEKDENSVLAAISTAPPNT
jgi:CBS domain-containing protein